MRAQRMTRMRSVVAILLFRRLLFLVIVGSCGGCSFVTLSSSVQFRDQEGVFKSDLLESIRPQETDEDWLLKHFGEPAFIQPADGEARLLTWPFLREQHKQIRVFLLFDSRKTSKETQFLHALVDQETVVAAWVDLQQQPSPQAVQKALGAAAEPAEPASQSQAADTAPPLPTALDPIAPDTDDPLGRRGGDVDDEMQAKHPEVTPANGNAADGAESNDSQIRSAE